MSSAAITTSDKFGLHANKPTKVILICGIPKCFHASDLRMFFSQFVESSKFACFHYRHRPDVEVEAGTELDGPKLLKCIKQKSRSTATCCAVLLVFEEHVDEFFRLYNCANWLDPNDIPLDSKCNMYVVKCGKTDGVENLLEFKPLSWMPWGNVGTPTLHFFNLIKECKLESSLISKLGLNFSVCARNRKYGAVPFDYGNSVVSNVESHSSPEDLECGLTYNSTIHTQSDPTSNDNFANVVDIDSDDDVPEEWDRFEALHDDPYNLDRGNKAQLKYESKVELVWEKGGSGLVFHTDQRTWEKLDPLRKEEIFDEPSSFDWDIDMQPYEVPTDLGTGPTPNGFIGGERDTTELIDINRERESMNVKDLAYDPYAAFKNEVISKGYGGKILERMGWIPGTALGVKKDGSKFISGLIDPITCEGSLPPNVRTGLGFYGPPIRRQSLNARITADTQKQETRSVYIRSVFDSPQTVAHRSGLGLFPSLLRRNDPGLVVKWLRDREASSNPLPNATSTVLDGPVPVKNRTIILNSYNNVSKEGISFISGGYLNPP
ncbi:unnamed protein product [Trichobilharzia szidati]|nr:unnamed protein product [Trichobilharzia szidati]